MAEPTKPIESVDLEKFMRFLLANSGRQCVVLVRLGFETGLRISDLLKLKYGQFKGQKTAFRIKEQKTGKFKTIRVSENMRQQIQDLKYLVNKSDKDFIFSVREGKPMSRTTAYRHLKRAGLHCGLDRVSPHSLRKTYAMNKFIESGGDIEFVREAMNHKYSSTTVQSYILSAIDTSTLINIMSASKRT